MPGYRKRTRSHDGAFTADRPGLAATWRRLHGRRTRADHGARPLGGERPQDAGLVLPLSAILWRYALSGIAALAVVAIVIVSTVSPLSRDVTAQQLSNSVFLPIGMNSFGPGALNSSMFGVEIYGTLAQLDGVKAMATARGLPAGFARRNHIDWALVEATRGTYNFASTDADMAVVASMNARPLIIVMGTPAWALPNGAYSINGPFLADYLPDYASFWKAIVARYSVPPYNVRFWEIYNEPDNTNRVVEGVTGIFGNAPTDYAKVLQTAYTAIKSVDPGATVLFGSLAHDFFNDSDDAAIGNFDAGGIFNRRFLEQVLTAGGGQFFGQYFDGVGFHYYPDYDRRWLAKKASLSPNGIAAKAESIRDVLKKFGLDKPLYNTEAGYASGVIPKVVSGDEETQAASLVQMFTRSRAAGLQSAVWYKLADFVDDQQSGDAFSWHGLVGSNGSKKRSFAAFTVTVRVLGTADYVKALSQTDLGVANVEGYLFRTAEGKDLRVLWAAAGASQTVTIPGASSLTITRKDDTSQVVTGGTFSLTSDPVFVVTN